MTITRTLEGFELIFSKGGLPSDEDGNSTLPVDNPNGLVARAILHIKMVDDSDGTTMIKTVRKETYDPVKMRKWGKRILGLASGDSDGFPGIGKLNPEE